MKIKIFGKLTDVFQGEEYYFPLESKITVNTFRKNLADKFTELKEATFLVIVNGQKAEDEQEISTESEVALLPPYSGG